MPSPFHIQENLMITVQMPITHLPLGSHEKVKGHYLQIFDWKVVKDLMTLPIDLTLKCNQKVKCPYLIFDVDIGAEVDEMLCHIQLVLQHGMVQGRPSVLQGK